MSLWNPGSKALRHFLMNFISKRAHSPLQNPPELVISLKNWLALWLYVVLFAEPNCPAKGFGGWFDGETQHWEDIKVPLFAWTKRCSWRDQINNHPQFMQWRCWPQGVSCHGEHEVNSGEISEFGACLATETARGDCRGGIEGYVLITAYSCLPFFSGLFPSLNLLLNSSSTDVCVAAEWIRPGNQHS